MTQWEHITTYIWVSIGSHNGLLPDSTKLLPKSVLTSHRWWFVLWYSLESNFTASAQATILYNKFEILLLNFLRNLPGTKVFTLFCVCCSQCYKPYHCQVSMTFGSLATEAALEFCNRHYSCWKVLKEICTRLNLLWPPFTNMFNFNPSMNK